MYLRLNPYDEVLQGICVSLRINEGIIKITGKNGAGKSALCSQLHDDLQANGQPAVLFHEAPPSAVALQNTIVDRLQLNPAGNFTRVLTAWLHARNAVDKPLVLIFDDAQRLDPPTFSAIRMLCNIQDGAHGLVRVVLCGSSELDARIDGPALRAVTQFISQSFTLPFLTRDQVHAFCQAYSLQCGRDIKTFDERALDAFFRETKGQPGLLYARLERESNQAEPVGMQLPDFAEAEVLLADDHQGKKPGSLRLIAIMVALLLIAGGAAYLYFAPLQEPVDGSPATAVVAPVLADSAEVLAIDSSPEADAIEAPVEVVADDVPSNAPTIEESHLDAMPIERSAIAEPEEAVADTAPAAASAIETSMPEAAGTNASAPQQVEDFIASWVASWQAQDVDAYLAHYHADFAPMLDTRAAWEEQRRRVITNASGIAITTEAPQSNAEAQDGMRVVRFWLDYRAANYADRTLKELVLARADGAWRIRVERNLRTEAL